MHCLAKNLDNVRKYDRGLFAQCTQKVHKQTDLLVVTR